jgi:DNA mismatch endonuclease (patch repair protein)
MMSGIRGKDTNPELVVRKGLFRRGFRYRLHDARLPGKPDIVLPKYRAIVLVNGCFWHGHGCHLFKWPKTRQHFWKTKILGNVERDRRNLDLYKDEGWRVVIVWECALKGKERLSLDSVISSITQWLYRGEGNLEISGRMNENE